MKILSAFVCLFIFATAFAQKQKQPKPDSIQLKLDAIFQKYNNKTGPGVALAIIQDGKVVVKKGYGLANMEYDIPITPASIFDIASVSKQFAGLAISMLVEQGKISLSDDIHKYVPEVPDFGQLITINHLVHHTSGLRDWPEGLNVAGWRWNEDFNWKDIQRMIIHQKELDFPPGTKYSYSNTGYNLLALVVERVSGKWFNDWTNENIFKPLQMSNSHFLEQESTIQKNMAYSYSQSPDGVWHKQMTGLTALGSSSLFTNVDDLIKWVIHFDSRIAAKDPIYMRMLETAPLNNGDKNTYAFGLGLGENSGLKTIGHTGGWAGYRTIILKFPDEKLNIILLGNDGGFNPSGTASDVARIFLGSKMTSTAAVDVDKIKDKPTIALNPEVARKQEGTYKLGDNWYVTLTLENGVLMTQANGEPKFPTIPKSDSTIWINDYNASATFVRSKDGSINALKYRGFVAPKIVPVTQDLSKLDQYSGTYYSEEFETLYKIDYTNNKLMMHHMRLGDYELTPDMMIVGAFNTGLGRIEFTTDNGKVSGFKLSRGRVKNLKFKKVSL